MQIWGKSTTFAPEMNICDMSVEREIVFFDGEKYGDLPYGTIYFVAGKKSTALNDFVRQTADKTAAELNADESHWVTCQIVCLDTDNPFFKAQRDAAFFSAILPEEGADNKGFSFLTQKLSDCEQTDVNSAFSDYFDTLLQMFDEVLDEGHFKPYHLRAPEPMKLCKGVGRMPVLKRAKTAVLGETCADVAAPCRMALEERPVYDSPSRLEITPNTYHVLLPDYEREIHFTAQVKALYVLFLNHPEGIRMKEIADYKDEYKQLYFHLTNRSDTDKLRGSVERLLDVCNPNALNVKKSQCNSAIYWAIPESALRHYYEIEVNRGQPHKINLDRALVSMPADLQQ